MSEITKLYENAGVEINKYKVCCTGCKHIAKLEIINGCPSKWFCDKYDDFADCDKAELDYSPFTAEKQLKIIKWLMNYPMLDEISLFFNEPSKTFNLRVYSLPEIGDFRSTYTETQNNFEDMLCGLINNLWQDLNEEERKQIKEILNG